MKYFIFSDVHSFYDELMQALEGAGFEKENPEHAIISCGDLLDRGDKPLRCLDFVNSIPSNRKILISGNHEDLLVRCLADGEFRSYDYSNGTVGTVISLGANLDSDENDIEQIFSRCEDNPALQKYLSEVVDFAEIGDNIFVHGWIPCNEMNNIRNNINKYTFDDNWRNGNWSYARWYNGMELWDQGIRIDGKTIFCGHWHTSWGHSHLHNDGVEWPNRRSTNPEHRKSHFHPFIDAGICAIDACTAFSHKVNVVTLEV